MAYPGTPGACMLQATAIANITEVFMVVNRLARRGGAGPA